MLIAKLEFTFYASETTIVTKMLFDFEGEDAYARDGDWSAANSTSERLAEIYLGETDGYWSVFRGSYENDMILMDERSPDGISTIWRSKPDKIARLFFRKDGWGPSSAVGKIFHLGLTGHGNQAAPPEKGFAWKVVGV